MSDGLKKQSSSSHLREGSSQIYGSSPFRNYQGNSGSGGSQNYNNNPLFESRYLLNNDPDQQNPFISGIRQLERRETIKSNHPFDFWQEEPGNAAPPQPFNLDWSQNFVANDDNLLRMSHNLEGSCLFTRRASSRI